MPPSVTSNILFLLHCKVHPQACPGNKKRLFLPIRLIVNNLGSVPMFYESSCCTHFIRMEMLSILDGIVSYDTKGYILQDLQCFTQTWTVIHWCTHAGMCMSVLLTMYLLKMMYSHYHVSLHICNIHIYFLYLLHICFMFKVHFYLVYKYIQVHIHCMHGMNWVLVPGSLARGLSIVSTFSNSQL